MYVHGGLYSAGIKFYLNKFQPFSKDKVWKLQGGFPSEELPYCTNQEASNCFHLYISQESDPADYTLFCVHGHHQVLIVHFKNCITKKSFLYYLDFPG